MTGGDGMNSGECACYKAVPVEPGEYLTVPLRYYYIFVIILTYFFFS